jgi:hypothetical protein
MRERRERTERGKKGVKRNGGNEEERREGVSRNF